MADQLAGTGLGAVDQLYKDRTRRIKQLKKEGKKIMGYFCCFPPVELFTALDLVPYRIMGNVSTPLSQADAYIEPVACSFVRTCVDMAVKGEYSFLDGLVMPECCDNITVAYNILSYNLKLPYSHFINVPHMLHQASFQFFAEELSGFKKSLEDFAGKKASNRELAEAIRLHNENRALARELYQLRKQDPPLTSGVEVAKTIVAAMSLPVREANPLFRSVIQEIKERPLRFREKRPRIFLYGAQIDDTTFLDIIEGSGAYLIMDDLCVGSRYYWHDVETDGDPLNNLSARYLEKLTCPRTYRTKEGTHQEDLDNRFGHILKFVKEFNIDGVILYLFRNCDTFAFDAPDVRDYLQGAGVPVLHLEDEYNMNSIARLKTRVQAFLEMIA